MVVTADHIFDLAPKIAELHPVCLFNAFAHSRGLAAAVSFDNNFGSAEKHASSVVLIIHKIFQAAEHWRHQCTSQLINEFGVKEKDQYIADVTYINGSKIANGNIEVENDYANKKYVLEGKLFDLVYDLNNLDSYNINLDYTDEVFKSLELYLFTTGKINENHYKYDGIIANKYDLEKVKTLKK